MQRSQKDQRKRYHVQKLVERQKNRRGSTSKKKHLKLKTNLKQKNIQTPSQAQNHRERLSQNKLPSSGKSKKKHKKLSLNKDSFSQIQEQKTIYKNLYLQALTAIKNMERTKDDEKSMHSIQMFTLMEKMKKLHKTLKSRLFFNHIYKYKEIDPQFMIPASVIVETMDENKSDVDSIQMEVCQQIMRQFLEIDPLEMALQSRLSPNHDYIHNQ